MPLGHAFEVSLISTFGVTAIARPGTTPTRSSSHARRLTAATPKDAQPVRNVVAEVLSAESLWRPRHGVVSDAAELSKCSYHERDDEDGPDEDAR